MKKLFFTSALLLGLLTSQSQKITVYYGETHSCSSDLFFAVQTDYNGQPAYRLTHLKTATPGISVDFDLSTDMSDKYVSAVDFTDPTRPMFGGAVGNTAVNVFYDAGMDIGTTKLILENLCAADEKKIYLTRDGEFHYTAK